MCIPVLPRHAPYHSSTSLEFYCGSAVIFSRCTTPDKCSHLTDWVLSSLKPRSCAFNAIMIVVKFGEAGVRSKTEQEEQHSLPFVYVAK